MNAAKSGLTSPKGASSARQTNDQSAIKFLENHRPTPERDFDRVDKSSRIDTHNTESIEAGIERLTQLVVKPTNELESSY